MKNNVVIEVQRQSYLPSSLIIELLSETLEIHIAICVIYHAYFVLFLNKSLINAELRK